MAKYDIKNKQKKIPLILINARITKKRLKNGTKFHRSQKIFLRNLIYA